MSNLVEAYEKHQSIIQNLARKWRLLYNGDQDEAAGDATLVFVNVCQKHDIDEEQFPRIVARSIINNFLEKRRAQLTRRCISKITAVGDSIFNSAAPVEFDRIEFLSKLTPDGREMANLVLNPTLKFIEYARQFPEEKQHTLKTIRLYLWRERKWHRDQVWNAVHEIRRVLKGG